jgi:hypothetical protein
LRRTLPTLLTLASAGLALPASAQMNRAPMPFSQFLGANNSVEIEPEDNDRTIPAISLLPEGSILEKVLIPRYDKDRKLTSVLRSDRMVLVRTDLISGESVSIVAYNPDRSQKARVDLKQALFDQKKNLLRADEAVTIQSDRLVSTGTGLVFSIEQSEGVLLGPAVTTITKPTPTAMNPARPGLRATALLGVSILPLIAAPPPGPTPEETARIAKESASMATEAKEASAKARGEMRNVLEESQKANEMTLGFLKEADLLAAAETDEPAPKSEPLVLPANPNRTTITNDGPIYFNSQEGAVVFLKKVFVKDPGYDLTAASELKVFFEKQAPKPKAADKKAGPKNPETAGAADEVKKTEKAEKKNALDLGSGSFGDPKSIVATGAVKIVQKNVPDGKDAVQASGNMVHYDLKNGTITISGGYPWFIQGSLALRANKENAWVRIDKDYNLSSDPNGGWTTDLNRTDLQKGGKGAPKQ